MTITKILESFLSNLKVFLNKNVSLENREVLKTIKETDIASWNQASQQSQYPITVTIEDDTVDIGRSSELVIPCHVIMQKLSPTTCNLLIRGRVAKNALSADAGTWTPLNIDAVRIAMGLNSLYFHVSQADYTWGPMQEGDWAIGHSTGAWYVSHMGHVGRRYDYALFQPPGTERGWGNYAAYAGSIFIRQGSWIRIEIIGATYS